MKGTISKMGQLLHDGGWDEITFRNKQHDILNPLKEIIEIRLRKDAVEGKSESLHQTRRVSVRDFFDRPDLEDRVLADMPKASDYREKHHG